jgi:hypothetical protein
VWTQPKLLDAIDAIDAQAFQRQQFLLAAAQTSGFAGALLVRSVIGRRGQT